jgi:DNA-binding transcriptional LysR family regulator
MAIDSIRIEEASKLPLILPSHYLGARKIINGAAAAYGVILQPTIEIDDPRLASQLVIEDLGGAILPPCLADLADDGGLLLRRSLTNPNLPYRLFLSFRDRPRFRRGRAERRVIDLMTATVGYDPPESGPDGISLHAGV